METEIFYTVEETADILHTSRKHVMTICRQKKLPGMESGRNWIIHREKLDNLIQRKTSFFV